MWSGLIAEVEQMQQFLELFSRAWTVDYQNSGGRIHCGRGCSGCCSLAVNCSFVEALAIARSLSEEQASRVADHVSRLVDRTAAIEGLKEYLRMYRDEIGACPFLDTDGACGIYPRRPLSCRALLSTREPIWCRTDFSGLDAAEKQAYMEGLDRSVVAFPLHFVASTQETGLELETRAGRLMADLCGFSLYGNLPTLVWLAREHGLAEVSCHGRVAVEQLLTTTGSAHPCLMTMAD